MKKLLLKTSFFTCILYSQAGFSLIEKMNFHSQKKSFDFYVDEEFVLIKSELKEQQGLNAEPLFESMGFSVALKKFTDKESVGHPIWFDAEKKSLGVLTRDIVVGVDNLAVLDRIKNETKGIVSEVFVDKKIYKVQYLSPKEAAKMANEIYAWEGVRFSHPNFLIQKDFRKAPVVDSGSDSGSAHKTTFKTDDPYYQYQWHLKNLGDHEDSLKGADINVEEAWSVTKGDKEIVIAVLDGGFETQHEEFVGQWFMNQGEIKGDGIDNDNNGFIDDTLGWNFYFRGPDVAKGSYQSHGTSVVGLVNAISNDVGVSGVCPNCKVLPIVVSWDVVDDAKAFYYAYSRNVHVISNSWGYAVEAPVTDVVKEAIDFVSINGRGGLGIPILFAMNNYHQNDCVGERPDISSLPSVIAISASSDQDKKISYAAYGECMEFLSPSFEYDRQGISTTDMTGAKGYNDGRFENDYADPDYTNSFSGTSAATPIAAGAIGLLLSQKKELTKDQVLELLIKSADKIEVDKAHYDDKGFSATHGFGRINVGRAMSQLVAP